MKSINFGLSPEHTECIEKTLRAENVSKAVIFGSRAMGNYRYNSDIDIAVFGTDINIGKIYTELDELPTPYKFDVVDYGKIKNENLREHINSCGKLLYE